MMGALQSVNFLLHPRAAVLNLAYPKGYLGNVWRRALAGATYLTARSSYPLGNSSGICILDAMEPLRHNSAPRKTIRFSLKYRPDFLQTLVNAQELTTTRLFDDKQLAVGDPVEIVVTETGRRVGTGIISKVRSTTFQDLFATATDFSGTVAMYEGYYGRHVLPGELVKDVTVDIRKQEV